MKANPWLLPGAALLVTGGWIVSQKQSAATLEREITRITERIQQAKAVADAESVARDAEAGKGKDGKIDWKDLAGKMGSMRNGGMPDMRAFMRLQKLLLDMSAEELCAQLDEIAALDLEDAAHSQLRGTILSVLADKDPKLTLDRFAHEIGDDTSSARWHLQRALGKWAETEPVAAAAWLDQQIAAGTFESKSLNGKNESFLSFEGALMNSLFKTDPAVVAARVEVLSDVQREELFQQGWFYQLKPEQEVAYAKLVRDSMPVDKVGKILAEKAGTLITQGGFERVDGFIASANATDDEKGVIVRRVIEQKVSSIRNGEFNEEAIEEVRSWAAKQSPTSVDAATGEALGSAMWQGSNFDKASSLALNYHESTGNDEVLAAFLKSNAARHGSADKAKALIDQIRDTKLREEIRALDEYKNK